MQKTDESFPSKSVIYLKWVISCISHVFFCVLESGAGHRGSLQECVTWEWVRGPVLRPPANTLSGPNNHGGRQTAGLTPPKAVVGVPR